MNAQFNATLIVRFAAYADAGMGVNKDTFTPATQRIFWTNGDGARQVNHIWFDQRTVPATTVEYLDLFASLTNSWGASIRFSKIKAIYFANIDTTATNELRWGPSTSAPLLNMFGGIVPSRVVRGGGIDICVCGDDDTAAYPVTATTADKMQVWNPGASAVTYNIALAGVGT